jgi:hypothetical protein
VYSEEQGGRIKMKEKATALPYSAISPTIKYLVQLISTRALKHLQYE